MLLPSFGVPLLSPFRLRMTPCQGLWPSRPMKLLAVNDRSLSLQKIRGRCTTFLLTCFTSQLFPFMTSNSSSFHLKIHARLNFPCAKSKFPLRARRQIERETKNQSHASKRQPASPRFRYLQNTRFASPQSCQLARLQPLQQLGSTSLYPI